MAIAVVAARATNARTGQAMKRRDLLKTAAAATAAAVAAPYISAAAAQGREDTLLTVSEGGPNNLDVMGVGTNLQGYEASWNTYDRLVSFAVKKDANGNDHYDPDKFEPELAESWDLGDMSTTFNLRKDAKFHDGSPVTARDVKWTFDRAVTVGGVPTFQMKAGSLEKPEQFVVVDDYTFRIDFLRKDKLTFPDLCVPTTGVINSALAKQHATDKDPWAMEWLKNNESGGGAYRVEKWVPGQELTYRRFDDWKCGPIPKLQRVIWRTVPSAGNRRALLERGDADISFNLPPRDVTELVEERKLTVVGTPIDCCLVYIDMNVKTPPFDNVKVRQAVAYAIPYQKIMDVALYNKARPLFGGSEEIKDAKWPQRSPYSTDLAKAKSLLVDAGLPNGFETTFSFDAGSAGILEPMSVLIQESLGQIGVKITLEKISGSNWRASFTNRKLPLLTNLFAGWLDYPNYYFEMALGKTSIFNSGDYDNASMMSMVRDARFERDPAKYDEMVKTFIKIAFDDVASIPLYQPYAYVAMQKRISGYRSWFHRQMDYRTLVKA